MQIRRVLCAFYVPILLCFGCGLDPFLKYELSVTVYASPEEVETAEAGPRTWLPCLMPEEFISFTEIHRVDAPRRCGVFEMDDAATRAFEQALLARGVPVDNPPVHNLRSFRTRQTRDIIDQFNALGKQKPWYRINCAAEGRFDYFIDENAKQALYVSVH